MYDMAVLCFTFTVHVNKMFLLTDDEWSCFPLLHTQFSKIAAKIRNLTKIKLSVSV